MFCTGILGRFPSGLRWEQFQWYIAASPGRSCAVAGAERRRTRENRTLPEEEIEEGANLPVPAPLPAWWVSVDLLWRS